MDDPSVISEQLKEMEHIDIRKVDPDNLRDIRKVRVKTELPEQERMLDYVQQIGNPYCYKHGKYIVKVSFIDTDVTLEQRMLAYIRSKCENEYVSQEKRG